MGVWWWISILTLASAHQLGTEQLSLFSLTPDYLLVKYVQTISINDTKATQKLQQFPAGVHRLLSSQNLTSFSAVLSQGEWRDFWGEAPTGESVDPGGTLMAVVSGGDWTERIWPALSQGLNGLLCSSFGTINTDQVSEMSIDQGINDQGIHLSIRLPLEALCTENLTPLTKLFACRTEAGLARLFKHRMWFAKHPYKTLRLEGFKLPTRQQYEFKATLSAVVHLPTSLDLNELINPDASLAPVQWISENIFQNSELQLQGCAAMQEAQISVVLPQLEDRKSTLVYHFNPFHLAASSGVGSSDDSFQINEIHSSDATSLQHLKFHAIISEDDAGSPTTLAGKLTLSFSNLNEDTPIDFKYFNRLEHFVTPLLHTIEAEINDGHSVVHFSGISAFNALGLHWDFPVESSNRSNFMINTSVPASSTLRFSFQFKKTFLHVGFFSFSPDRGLSWPGGLLIQQIPHPKTSIRTELKGFWETNEGAGYKDNQARIWRFTGSHYAMFALPDLSMPFNVVAMTCTAMMIFMGSIIKIAVTRPGDGKSTSPVAIVFRTLQRHFRRKRPQINPE